jgi:hypothetical protein
MMKKNQKVCSKDNLFPVLFKNNLVSKSSNSSADAFRSRRSGSKKVGVKKQIPLQRLQIPKKRPSTAFIKSNISRPLEASKESCMGRKKRTGRSRSFQRPVTAPTFFHPSQQKSTGIHVLTAARLEKNALWRKKEETRERRRAEIYAINKLLKLGFESDFREFMNAQN